MYLTNIQPLSSVIGSLPLINPLPKSKIRGSLPLTNPKPEQQGIYQWQISNDQRQGSYICWIHHSSHGSYDIIILWGHHTSIGQPVYYNENNLYLCYVPLCRFIELGWSKIEFMELAIVLHMIDEFKFQREIHCDINARKKSLYLYNNTTRWIHY